MRLTGRFGVARDSKQSGVGQVSVIRPALADQYLLGDRDQILPCPKSIKLPTLSFCDTRIVDRKRLWNIIIAERFLVIKPDYDIVRAKA
jgi:hypothetical protein